MGIAIKKTIDRSCGWFETAQRAELDRNIHEDHLRGKVPRRKPGVVVENRERRLNLLTVAGSSQKRTYGTPASTASAAIRNKELNGSRDGERMGVCARAGNI